MTTARNSASSPESNSAPALIEVFNKQRLHPIQRKAVAVLGRAVLDRIGRGEATFAITFIRDRRMRELNRDFRSIDAPTDVLSFAYHEGASSDEPEGDSTHLGDLVISTETAARYADELSLKFSREIEHLVIHGALHLAGYDHETDNGEMNRLEKRLRRELLERSPK
jgi:probable rRNA maturation factor